MSTSPLPAPIWPVTGVRLLLEHKQPCSLRDWEAPIEFQLAGVTWRTGLSWFEGEDFNPAEAALRQVNTHLTRAMEKHGFSLFCPPSPAADAEQPNLFPNTPA